MTNKTATCRDFYEPHCLRLDTVWIHIRIEPKLGSLLPAVTSTEVRHKTRCINWPRSLPCELFSASVSGTHLYISKVFHGLNGVG